MTSITRQQLLKWTALFGLGAWLPTAARADEGAAASGAVRRVVTGLDASGHSVIVKDAVAPHVYRRQAEGIVITELWSTNTAPSNNRSEADPTDSPLRLAPPTNGSTFRVLSFLPNATSHVQSSVSAPHADDSGISTALAKGGRAPGFHVTNTTDYVVVLSGEIYALLDSGEVLLKPGDVLIQRGTSHAWENRSSSPASIAFVLIDAQPLT